MSLRVLISNLYEHPALIDALTIDTLILFFRLTTHLKLRLSWHRASSFPGPPLFLPFDITHFMSSALQVNFSIVNTLWSLFGDLAWSSVPSDRSTDGDLVDLFLQHGPPFDVAFYNLYPPTRTCLDPRCVHVRTGRTGVPQELAHLTPIHVVYFSREFGPVPGLSFSATCRRCNTRYYPAYYVHEHASSRTYYQGVPSAIHAATHVYIETSLCDRFTNSMACAWVSGTNNARIYNLEHRDAQGCFPQTWSITPALTTTLVWDAFFLLGLLREHSEQGTHLEHGNKGDLAERLNPALHARNLSMVGPGRENWNHACDKCCAHMEKDGKHYIMRAAVMDGVTIGRPCCKVHDCKRRLPTQRARFCEFHAAMDALCVVVGCEVTVSPGFKTCSEPSHRELEDLSGHSALFQLRRRLERLKTKHIEDDGDGLTEELVDVDTQGENPVMDVEKEPDGCPSKSDEGNSRPRARFGRRRTHNEQLCVATCGVMLARATFYGSEGLNGAAEFLHITFPTPKSLPAALSYDNACSFKKHVQAKGDSYFDGIAMPVDVFHMKTKHKETDTFCGQYCNPAMFPDLVVNGRWRFNTSAAEMTNAWIGGFGAIVREMRPDRYDFFLDEMIKHRNRMIVDDLRERDAYPFEIPRSLLLL